MRLELRHILALPLLLAMSGAAAAFPTQDDNTPGSMAINFDQHSNIWSSVDFGFLDGKIETSPPDSTKYDRRLETLVIVGFDAAFTKRFAARVNLKGEMSKRRQDEKEPPRATVDETIVTYAPAVDLTFTTEKGLEIFAGAMAQITPAYGETVSSANGESKTQFSKASVLARRFGVVRRAGAWSGGFYYVMGAEAERKIEQTAFDGSGTTATDTVFVPSQIGVMGEFKAGGGVWDFELDFVQARGMGPKDDRANTTLTDYFTARAGTLYELGGGFGLRASVAHKTLSYANNAFVTLDTIPVTSLKLLGLLGSAESHAFFGIIGAYGRDGQSLPEFNAHYQMVGAALTTGFNFSL